MNSKIEQLIGMVQGLCDVVSDTTCGCKCCPYNDTIGEDDNCEVQRLIAEVQDGGAENGKTD